ncbi:MAG: calcineurin-like phosphoesterase C-terminal domain-containing protein, partial [Pseudomonadota bacterium]
RDYAPGVLLDGRMSAAALDAATIIVNLFDGGPRSEVAYQVNNGEFQPMARVLRKDPYIVEQFNRHRDSKKSWVEAMPSTHLFEADFGDDLTAGTYRVTVRAKDEFGRVHHSHAIVEITAQGNEAADSLSYPAP